MLPPTTDPCSFISAWRPSIIANPRRKDARDCPARCSRPRPTSGSRVLSADADGIFSSLTMPLSWRRQGGSVEECWVFSLVCALLANGDSPFSPVSPLLPVNPRQRLPTSFCTMETVSVLSCFLPFVFPYNKSGTFHWPSLFPSLLFWGCWASKTSCFFSLRNPVSFSSTHFHFS